jgi:xylulokinase
LNILTIDIGTSELKISVFSPEGDALKVIRTETRLSFHGSHAELRPNELWKAVCNGIQALGSDMRASIASAAISAHGESFAALDSGGVPIRDMIMNIDSRATVEMEEYARAFGRQELFQRTGLPSHPMYTLPKILWMRHHEPTSFARATKFLCAEDFILFRLGLEPVISQATASRLLGFDLATRAWDPELLALCGISEDQLARTSQSGVSLGTARASVSAQLGIPANVVWCVAGYDQACASIGAGVAEPGSISDGTGTFECASIPTTSPLLSAASLAANLPCGAHVLPDHFLTLAYVPGGIALKWLRENWFCADSQDYDVMLRGLPVEPTGVFCFPFFIGTGTPWLESEAKATLYGLTNSTTPLILTQAMLEGVSYEMRWNLEIVRGMNVRLDRLFAAGGGAKSDVWLQLKSDIFGCPVVRIPGEASSRGAAICASMGMGQFRSWSDAITAMVKHGQTFEPRPREQRRYHELFQEYKQLAQRIYGHQSRST